MKSKYNKKTNKRTLKITRKDYSSAKRLKSHLEKEHPSTKNNIKIV